MTCLPEVAWCSLNSAWCYQGQEWGKKEKNEREKKGLKKKVKQILDEDEGGGRGQAPCCIVDQMCAAGEGQRQHQHINSGSSGGGGGGKGEAKAT